jgi:tRNA threonylcarbamoyl adenosine modification protein YeaZ
MLIFAYCAVLLVMIMGISTMSDQGVSAPVVLGIDTSTVVTVGLARGAEVLAVGVVTDRMAHAEQLTPLIARCLAEAGLIMADVDQIVVGLGPGPFTGLRVGIVTAQVLSSVLRRPLHGVCSLDVIAAQYAGSGAGVEGEFLAVSDARRREVYWARYAANGVRSGAPQVSAPDALPDLPVVGPGASLCVDRRQADGPDRIDPGTLATRGPGLPDAGREPLYLRRPDATEPTRPKSVLHFVEGRR